ncbi:MAG: proteasome accessory factor PafA2 family protein [Deltaproteobacteria bacterium]|nr:proteasome accessory factor PafA2 family protein [Deltaproteobacteria bacterium]
MLERVFGIETEYAVVYFPARGEEGRPTNLSLYPLFEGQLSSRVPSVPRTLSLLRAKPGRFLANGMSFHYEATPDAFEHGLLEIASPECRDPFSLLAHERAKDELVELLRVDVNRDLRARGWRGEVRIFKSNVDAHGHTFGSHESYWIDDPLPVETRLALAPLWVLLWLATLPSLLWLVSVSLLMLTAPLLLLLLPLLASGIRLAARGIRRVWPELAQAWRRAALRLSSVPIRVAARLQADPGLLARHLAWIDWPIRPFMSLHAAFARRFFFRPAIRGAMAHLVTRTLYCGAGRLVFEGRDPLHCSQRAEFMRVPAHIFTHGEHRPLVELRDLFFRPWSAFGRYRRLHLMLADATQCDQASILRIGTTALVLEAIEALPEAPWPELADPVAGLRSLSRDAEAVLRLRDGTKANALAIQRQVLQHVRERLPDINESWKRRVLALWKETLDQWERDPDELADRVDWIAKRSLLYRDCNSPEDWMRLAAQGRRLLTAGTCDGEQERLRQLVFRMLRTDLRYHDLGPRGGHRRLRGRGRVREWAEADAIAQAHIHPPADTRAYARGLAIREAAGASVPGAATWHRVRVGLWDWHWLLDPLHAGPGLSFLGKRRRSHGRVASDSPPGASPDATAPRAGAQGLPPRSPR